MPIYRTFAVNLRKACDTQDSIASVCRGTGINRQQFNKYLSGKALPNSRNLAKISGYLGLPEETFFLSDHDIELNTSSEKRSGQGCIAAPGLSSLDHSLSDGFYFCYFPIDGQPTHLVRSIISVSKRDQQTYFARRTVFKSPSQPSALLFEVKHRGFVTANRDTIYLIGCGPDDTSYLALNQERMPLEEIYFGVAVVTGNHGPFACRVCVERLGQGLAVGKTSMLKLGIVPKEDTTVNPVVSYAMKLGTKVQDGVLGILKPSTLLVTD